MKKLVIALALAGASNAAVFTPATAGPLPTQTAAVTRAAPDHATNIYWRRWGPGLAFGLAAGALAGAAIASPFYGAGRYYYLGAPAPYLYARPVYAAPYGYPAPVYLPPPVYAPYGYYGYRRCYTDEGYGRWTPCDTTGQR
ncbi:MAG: hypothetical protein WDO17_13750 [Alphaproteobacteria bacterium]